MMKLNRHRLAAILAVLMVVACENPQYSGFVVAITTDRAYLGAELSLDGIKLDAVEYKELSSGLGRLYYKWRYPDSPIHDMIGAVVELDPSVVASGTHSLVLSTQGQPTIEAVFVYPKGDEEPVCFVAMMPDYVVVGDNCKTFDEPQPDES